MPSVQKPKTFNKHVIAEKTKIIQVKIPQYSQLYRILILLISALNPQLLLCYFNLYAFES